MPDEEWKVTLADHEAGFAEVPALKTTGQPVTVRINALPRRKALAVARAMQDGKNPFALLEAAVKGDSVLDELDAASLAKCESTAWIINIAGWDGQKKLEAAAEKMTRALLSRFDLPELKSPSAAPDSAEPK